MYIIVNFEEENAVEAVPKNWFNNGYCVWPKKSQNINKYIKKNSNPDEFPHILVKACQMSKKTCKCLIYFNFKKVI